MKKLAVLILGGAIFISCQTRATNLIANINENSAEIKSLFSPTPTPSLTPKPRETFNIHSKIGFAEVSDDKPGCLRTKNGNLAEKTPVSIIVLLDEPPQKVLTATVEKKLAESCAPPVFEKDDKNPGEDFFYSLNLKNPVDEEVFYYSGIAVIEPKKPIRIQNKLASNDLDEDGKPEFFRFCTGYESLHFTVWTGRPLKGKRIWHSYFHVNYDTVPTCKEKDWEGLED